MKRFLAAVLAVWLGSAGAASVVRAQEAKPPATTPQGLFDVPFPEAGAPCTVTADDPQGAPPSSSCPGLADRDPFSAGTITFQVLSGYFSHTALGPSPIRNNPGKGNEGFYIDYIPQVLRVSVMCNDPHPDWKWCSGVFEMNLEMDTAPIVRTFGHYFAGPNTFIRYNFVHPDCILVPYIQGGAGFVFNDAWQNHEQRLIGEFFEFLLRAEVGVRVMITENFALNIEGGFQHISNADLASRNGGINNLGGMIGFTWFYGKP
jgi:hypothetical protein